MMLIDSNKISKGLIVEIGKELGILIPNASISDHNIQKVLNSTKISLDIALPTYVVDSRVKGAEFKINVE